MAAAGGFTMADRVNGVLAISRSFGDTAHKESADSSRGSATTTASQQQQQATVVVATPEARLYTRSRAVDVD